MKSAYELAMERLEAKEPGVTLSEEQRSQLMELDRVYQAKQAEKEIFLQGEMAKARERGDAEALDSLERQLVADRSNLQAELKAKKEQIRAKV